MAKNQLPYFLIPTGKMSLENTNTAFESVLEKAIDFGNDAIELAKLKAISASSSIVSFAISKLITILSISVFLIIFSIGLSIYIGTQMGDLYLGFMTISIFYLILTIIFHRKLYQWIKRPLTKIIIRQTLGQQ